ncbi:MAG: FeoB-associated Cys-rich membrane protein [Oscillospiraceae bacterium]|nr:FeoB-associated Cys-rich membrane protein [Oscillospiraceae bacterium]
MNAADIVLLLLIAASVIWAVRRSVKRARRGGCGCGCDGCTGCETKRRG